MRIFKQVALAALIAATAFTAGTSTVTRTIQGPQEPYADIYRASFALYASSVEADVTNKFICSAQAIKKVSGGYELLSAGHCTPANAEELPPDMVFSVAEDIGGALMPVVLVKAELTDTLDYAIFYLQTKNKYPADSLGDLKGVHIGDPTVDVNFSEGLAKELSPGLVASKIIANQPEEHADLEGLFEVQMFGSHGASGSAVIDQNTGKVIGIVTMGSSGTMPLMVEPIYLIEAAIKGVDILGPAEDFSGVAGSQGE
jgi:hypothetical protein